jgi:OmpA-OmpF porin, OOP family
MRQIAKIALVGFATLALAACETDNLDSFNAAQSASPSGSAFDNALYGGYSQLASEEQNPYGDYGSDVTARDQFSGRALAAANGDTVLPEMVSARMLPPGEVDGANDVRRRLVAALDAGGRAKAPNSAARAQVMFDCWLEQLEENYQPADIARCRQGLNDALAEVDEALRPPPPPPPPPAPAQAEPFLIFFDLDSATITADSAEIIRRAADVARASGAASIEVVGHTDTSGSNAHNDALSLSRAAAVRDALVANGVMTDSISVEGRGENDPLVSTADGVPEERNRRAQGVWIYR